MRALQSESHTRARGGGFAPRSGASKLARGTRFLRTPGKAAVTRNPHPERARGLPARFQRAGRAGCLNQGLRCAYPWLISRHPFGVSFKTETVMANLNGPRLS